MTTEQQTAEAYVRSQIPELMELSMGCLVYTGTFSPLQHVLDADEDTLIVSSTVNGLVQEYKRKDIANLFVVGHRIQLQHWLILLKNIDRIERHTENRLCVYLYLGNKQYQKIMFSLTTGQPATEADYKAFNDIVGV
jgi:hypothetical protein